MKITPNQLFRDGHTTYQQGEEYDVPDLDGARFVGNGWATSPDYSLPGAASTGLAPIKPDSVSHKAAVTEVQ